MPGSTPPDDDDLTADLKRRMRALSSDDPSKEHEAAVSKKIPYTIFSDNISKKLSVVVDLGTIPDVNRQAMITAITTKVGSDSKNPPYHLRGK